MMLIKNILRADTTHIVMYSTYLYGLYGSIHRYVSGIRACYEYIVQLFMYIEVSIIPQHTKHYKNNT